MPAILKDEDLETRWIAALRSGAYRKCTGALTRGGSSRCALGVLCDEANIGYSYKELRPLFIDQEDVSTIERLNDQLRYSFITIAHYIELPLRSYLSATYVRRP